MSERHSKKKKLIIKRKEETIIHKKDLKGKLLEYIDNYSNLSDEQILDKSKEIISMLNVTSNFTEIEDYENQLEALKNVIDQRLFDKEETSPEDLGYYPDYTDSKFNEKIIKKKEFYINKSTKFDINTKLDEHSKKSCQGFQLSDNQKFLKTFLSSNTPYNGILLFHGTGVGKTCSSISIAEQYRTELKLNNQKVIILLNPSIKANFVKNIFNIQKVKQGLPKNQCLGDTYLKEIGKYSNLEDLQLKANKLIDSRYEIYGYLKFANMIERIKTKSTIGIPKELQQKYIRNMIKQQFSNCVLIIDEAHNIKMGNSEEAKKLPPILEQIMRTAENMKLVLLTATPMFDNATEIIWLLNLLLMNDKKPTIKISDIFNADGTISTRGKKILNIKSRGYISYLRGENPIKFPFRLYPDIDNHPRIIKVSQFPTTDIKGIPIPEKNRLQSLKIIGCPMMGSQLEVYSKLGARDNSSSSYGAFDSTGILASNIVFPSDKYETPSSFISNEGFNKVFSKNKNTYHVTDPKYQNFLDIENIKNYSSKIASIIQNIKTSKGIVFIYSQFIWGGIMPLALALEYNGFSKYNSNNLLDNPNTKEPITYSQPDGSKSQGKYIIISGVKSISTNYEDYIKIEDKNKNGELVKVILGSQTASEGLDFKYIREVHILDPWHHYNKIEQIIGRAIRWCSHIDLDIKERNVTVYQYASTMSDNPSNDNETIDLKMYRTAEQKLKQMSLVEYQLKINSVDCNLNQEANKFIGDYWEKPREIITSQGNTKRISINDVENSKVCNFRECDYKCVPDISEKLEDSNLNYNTFKPNLILDHIDIIIQDIQNLYNQDLVFDIYDIKEKLDQINLTQKRDNMLIYLALQKMLDEQLVFSDMYDRDGFLIYKGGFYIFQPLRLKKMQLSIQDVRKPLTIKNKKIDISNYVNDMDLFSNSDLSLEEANIPQLIQNILDKDAKIISSILQASEKKLSKANQSRLLGVKDKLPLFIIDSIDLSEKEILIRYFLKNLDSEFSSNEKRIFNYLDKNLLRYNRDIYYGDSEYESYNDIWGYKIVKNNELKYYKLNSDSNTFEIASETDLANIKRSIGRKPVKDMSIIIGYMLEKLPEKKIIFKIRDKTGEGKKGTHIKTGSICGNEGMKKEKLVTFINKITDTQYYHKTKITSTSIPTKDLLCLELELYLRLNDLNNKENKRWFFNIEESIEFKLHL